MGLVSTWSYLHHLNLLLLFLLECLTYLNLSETPNASKSESKVEKPGEKHNGKLALATD